LTVVGFGRLDFLGIALYNDVAKKPQDPRLMSPFLVGLSEIECMLGEG
jgi:hypothetical protein